MKYLKLFEAHITEHKIKKICKKYNIVDYSINDDLSIDVYGYVDLFNLGLKELPLKFNRVGGGFNCSHNQLTSLKGAPREVGDYFSCHKNKLTSLEHAPKEVGDYFTCSYNNIKSLKGLTEKIKGNIFITNNPVEYIYDILMEDGLFMIEEFNDLEIIYFENNEWCLDKERFLDFLEINDLEIPYNIDKLVEKHYKIV